MDTGLLGRWVKTRGGSLRDRVLVAVMGVAAATDGRLTQARVLSMRVSEARQVLGDAPFARNVHAVVRQYVTQAGLGPDDPVFASRKRDTDGRRRPVSRIQAYRVIRAKSGSGWSRSVATLIATRRPAHAPPGGPRPTHAPPDLETRLSGRPGVTVPEVDEDRGEQEPEPDDYEQPADW